MAVVFNPTAEETRALEALIAELPRIQDTLVQNHPQLTRPDRGAHQQQLAGSKVLLTVERSLVARYKEKQEAGQWVPNLGPL